MKTVSAGLANHLSQEVTTLATCWKATLADTTVYGFTDHDSDFSFAGTLYKAASGFTPTAIESSAALNVDNLELEGLLDSADITEADIAAGRWDYAQVEIFAVNYADLTQGALKLRKGRVGEISAGRGSFVAEMRGLAQAYTQSIGVLYSPGCRARLGDSRCGINLTAWTVTGTVTGVTSNRVFADASRAEAAGYFDFGKLTWTSGDNSGLSIEVKAYAIGSISLVASMPYAVQIGDAYSMHVGCAKRFTEDCRDRFSNVANFRGEPHVPGVDLLTKGVR